MVKQIPLTGRGWIVAVATVATLAGSASARAESCDAVVAKVQDLAKAGRINEARRYKSRLESCSAQLQQQLNNQKKDMAEGYDNLIRKARSGRHYDGPSTFAASCEEAAKLRLRSPSTYRRVSSNELTPENITAEQFLSSHSNSQHARDALAQKNAAPVRLRAFISYDAANAYGTPVRDTVECTYDAAGLADIPGPYTVRLNGSTALETMSFNR